MQKKQSSYPRKTIESNTKLSALQTSKIQVIFILSQLYLQNEEYKCVCVCECVSAHVVCVPQQLMKKMNLRKKGTRRGVGVFEVRKEKRKMNKKNLENNQGRFQTLVSDPHMHPDLIMYTHSKKEIKNVLLSVADDGNTLCLQSLVSLLIFTQGGQRRKFIFVT